MQVFLNNTCFAKNLSYAAYQIGGGGYGMYEGSDFNASTLAFSTANFLPPEPQADSSLEVIEVSSGAALVAALNASRGQRALIHMSGRDLLLTETLVIAAGHAVTLLGDSALTKLVHLRIFP